MKWILRNALVSLLGLIAILAVVAAGVVMSPSQSPATVPSPTPHPGGWTFEPRSWGTTAPPPPVYVVETLSSAWPVGSALKVVDVHTASRAYVVKRCPATAKRCVTVRSGAIKGGPSGVIGWTSCKNWRCTITIDTKDAARSGQFGPKTRKWLLVHEFGHVFGLGHRKACSTAMNPYRRCNGHVPPLYFDASQRRTLHDR